MSIFSHIPLQQCSIFSPWVGTNLLDPETEVEDAVWRVALAIGPTHLPDKLGQRHVELLGGQRHQVTFGPSCRGRGHAQGGGLIQRKTFNNNDYVCSQ